MATSRTTEAYQYEKHLNDLPDLRSTDGTPEDMIDTVKIFTPDGPGTWFLTEYDPDTRRAFGLCDLGAGFPELGYVSIDELESVTGAMGLPPEVDLHNDKTLKEAREVIE